MILSFTTFPAKSRAWTNPDDTIDLMKEAKRIGLQREDAKRVIHLQREEARLSMNKMLAGKSESSARSDLERVQAQKNKLVGLLDDMQSQMGQMDAKILRIEEAVKLCMSIQKKEMLSQGLLSDYRQHDVLQKQAGQIKKDILKVQRSLNRAKYKVDLCMWQRQRAVGLLSRFFNHS